MRIKAKKPQKPNRINLDEIEGFVYHKKPESAYEAIKMKCVKDADIMIDTSLYLAEEWGLKPCSVCKPPESISIRKLAKLAFRLLGFDFNPKND